MNINRKYSIGQFVKQNICNYVNLTTTQQTHLFVASLIDMYIFVTFVPFLECSVKY